MSRAQLFRLGVVWLLAILIATITLNVHAGARPGAEDAACDALELSHRSSAHRATPREMNYMLFEASSQGCIQLVSKVLDNGAVVEARDRFGNTALLIAAKMGHEDILELLVSRGSDVHDLNLAGSSALLRAIRDNRRKTAKLLLEASVDPDLANEKGVTPLIGATFNGNRRLVDLLLKYGADPAAQDNSGKGPVVYAAGKGYLSLVKLMLETDKLDINARYGNELTVLMWAAGHSNDVPEKDGVATVEHLLSEGADHGAVDNRGRSALMIAAERGHTQVVDMLLQHGSNPALKDKTGLSALDLAANDESRSLLERAAVQ